MTQLRCLRAELLLERRGAGLSPADALRLEDHLAGCEHCNEQARLLAGLRSLMDQLDTPLPPQARERAIAGALSGAPATPSSARSRGMLEPRAWVPALAVAAAFGLALGLGLRAKAPQTPTAKSGAGAAVTSASASASATATRVDRVLSGRVELDGQVSAEGAALAETSVLHAIDAASVALGQARVEMRAGTRLRWQRSERRVQLEAGSVLADVDPSAHQSFMVETSQFRVLVLGTRFEVSLEGVSVERGRVRVLGLDGRALTPDLGPGGRYAFTASQTGSSALNASDAAPAPLAARNQPKPASPRPTERASAHERSSQSAKPAAVALPALPAPVGATRAEHADAAGLLEIARKELAAKQVASARQQIDAALALSPAPGLRAEALSLRADCALVEGDLGAAVAAYSQVAQSFAELPAGENALFAAARLEADRGRHVAAVAGLRRYLARYPRGRFVKEAQLRLRELGAEPDRDP